jgi:hypothetical protein
MNVRRRRIFQIFSEHLTVIPQVGCPAEPEGESWPKTTMDVGAFEWSAFSPSKAFLKSAK